MVREASISFLIYAAALSLGGAAFSGQAAAAGKKGGKSFLVTAPLVSLTREAQGRVEFNLLNKGTIAFEASFMPDGEELSDKEIEENPGDSLITSGREYKLMVSRFSQAQKMGGWYWGLGVGMRHVHGTWVKSPYVGSEEHLSLADEDGKITNHVDIKGTTLEGRTGYRYVASDLGFMIGLYIRARHFQGKVQNSESAELSGPDDSLVRIHDHDSDRLKRRLMSNWAPNLEIGWAF